MRMYEQRVHNSNKGDVFAYDEVYRLKDVKFNSPEPTNATTELFEKQKSYQFDKVDNILKIVENRETQANEILTTLEGNNYRLNQYTRFDEWGLSYDQNGNTTQKGVQQFTYDYRNQLLSAQDLNIEINYRYDPFGRRVEKTIGSNTTKYFYDFNQVIEERDSSNQVTKQYVYGSGIDEVLRMDKYESGTPIPYYYHTNAIGSVTAITDQSGDLVERVSYDTFGMPTITGSSGEVIPASTIGNEYLFQGRRYDKTANLYYYRARYYDPIMGRFLQTDPMGYRDSMNLYQGLAMNPVNFVDPFGNVINISGRTIKYFGNYDKALEYVNYTYAVYRQSLDMSHENAYQELIDKGLVNDSIETELYFATRPFLDVFDVAPGQFAKDTSAGILNAVVELIILMAKSQGSVEYKMNGGYDIANEEFQRAINEAIGANDDSIGHFLGKFYTPVVVCAIISAQITLASQTAQTDDTLYFLKYEQKSTPKYWAKSAEIGGKKVYQRDDLFDPNFVSSWREKGKVVTGTNLERMATGRAPIGYDGKSVNLHHLTQSHNGPLAEVSQTFHQEYYKIMHINTGSLPSSIKRSIFSEWKKVYWILRAKGY